MPEGVFIHSIPHWKLRRDPVPFFLVCLLFADQGSLVSVLLSITVILTQPRRQVLCRSLMERSMYFFGGLADNLTISQPSPGPCGLLRLAYRMDSLEYSFLSSLGPDLLATGQLVTGQTCCTKLPRSNLSRALYLFRHENQSARSL